MTREYEKPIAETVLFASVMPVANVYEPGGPSDMEEGFEKWPEEETYG